MSGIAGIFHQDGAPVDGGLLRALTRFLSYRGPDGRETWTSGSIGLGHTLLRTSTESASDRQPASLDGRFWVTADARIDCREDLKKNLEASGQRPSGTAADSELILSAYAAWGEECVDRLRGDFSFALWDSREKKLFCARDHLGIKPFYYARIGSTFIFSNTLDCVRLHPLVGGELNDQAVVDFLLVGVNCDETTTTFRDVQRLAPAHCLTISTGGICTRRYWSPPTDGRIRYRDATEYVEHFQELLHRAVSDRMRGSRVGIFLSGGLDSGAVAATARHLTTAESKAVDLRAYTVVYESLIPDSEGPFAQKTAEFLHIPIRFLVRDTLKPFERLHHPDFAWPEPVEDPFFAGLFDDFQTIAKDCRVVLSGDGGDDLMRFQMWPFVRDQIRNREWRSLFLSTLGYLSVRQVPWRGALRRVRRLFGRDPLAPVFPSWIRDDVLRKLDFRARWEEQMSPQDPFGHPVLPKAHAALRLPQWSCSFENSDPGLTRCLVELRHPILDLRVMAFLLALPPFPCFFEKRLLRESLSGRIPEDVRRRPKSPLAGDPLTAHVKAAGAPWSRPDRWCEEMDRFVVRSAIPQITGESYSEEACAAVRPFCLNFWLQSLRRVRYILSREAANG
ncbi:MAG TPA: asparagine synthase-related protein [Candidatus Limnocylindrales bacterium]|nr:asparagine synthase-related protein [Candidatus Limnocylindrales bacterium]